MIPGYATRPATEEYVRTFGSQCAPGHYSDFLNLHLRLSSLGLGTFPGAAADEVDQSYADIIGTALQNGINVVDTASHYRYGRSERAVGKGLRRALAKGVKREQVFIASKGGFLVFPEEPPVDFEVWFEQAIMRKGLGKREDLAQTHLISPQYVAWQIERSRQSIGVETLDAFLVDQPELHIPAVGKEQLNRKLEQVFAVLEQAVKENKIRCYGISTYHGFRVETDAPLFESLTSLQGLAEKAARLVHQDPHTRHGLKVVQLPFNQGMLEGFTRFNQATGQGNVASAIQAAYQLKVYVMASHAMMKGHLAAQCVDSVERAMPELKSHAQRSLQFNRSTPGIGTSLVGISTLIHLDDLLAVARIPPMAKGEYLRLYQRADNQD